MGLIEAKICDVTRETRGGFNFGRARLDGIRGSRGHTGAIEFQNENLIAYLDGEPVATTPDLICLVDCDTFIPVTTESLKYGKRVIMLVLPCDPVWRTQAGIDLAGPDGSGTTSTTSHTSRFAPYSRNVPCRPLLAGIAMQNMSITERECDENHRCR